MWTTLVAYPQRLWITLPAFFGTVDKMWIMWISYPQRLWISQGEEKSPEGYPQGVDNVDKLSTNFVDK
jgi:hypothetical protein